MYLTLAHTHTHRVSPFIYRCDRESESFFSRFFLPVGRARAIFFHSFLSLPLSLTLRLFVRLLYWLFFQSCCNSFLFSSLCVSVVRCCFCCFCLSFILLRHTFCLLCGRFFPARSYVMREMMQQPVSQSAKQLVSQCNRVANNIKMDYDWSWECTYPLLLLLMMMKPMVQMYTQKKEKKNTQLWTRSNIDPATRIPSTDKLCRIFFCFVVICWCGAAVAGFFPLALLFPSLECTE